MDQWLERFASFHVKKSNNLFVDFSVSSNCFNFLDYCSLMGLTVFYFFASFQSILPWAVCNPEWVGPERCESNSTDNHSVSLPQLYFE